MPRYTEATRCNVASPNNLLHACIDANHKTLLARGARRTDELCPSCRASPILCLGAPVVNVLSPLLAAAIACTAILPSQAQSTAQSQSPSQDQSAASLPPGAAEDASGPVLFTSSSLGASSPLPDAPSEHQDSRRRYPRPELAVASHTRPFSTLALALTLGDGGIGFDLATPLNTRINLRAGAGLFSYNTNFVVDTIPISGALHLGNAHASLDWFLFNNSFHISPGITLYNETDFNARILVPGNQIVTLNDQDYTSDPSDPIHGNALINFGNKIGPRLTVGWGNMIPHRDQNWTFPVEFGVDYRKAPTAVFTLAGSSCDSQGDCGPIQTDPDTQINIDEQQREIVNDLRPLRFFPILTFGVSYKFGH